MISNLFKAALIVALIPISACSMLDVLGKPEPGCSKSVKGLGCRSLPEVYELTHGEDYKEVIRHQMELEEKEKKEKEEGKGAANHSHRSFGGGKYRRGAVVMDNSKDEALGRKVVASNEDKKELFEMNYAGVIQPMRTGQVKLKIWVAPFKDESDNLYQPGFIHRAVGQPDWNIGEPIDTENKLVSPLY